MKISFEKGAWEIEREETQLDGFVKEFAATLESCDVKYVLVSGYVAILFGRSRNSEDVDFFIEQLDFERFEKLWQKMMNKFDPVVSSSASEAYTLYLSEGLSTRIAPKGKIIPNAEIKFPTKELQQWALEHAIDAYLNGFPLKITPLESQIPYKLLLGSQKDFEDAEHLWLVTKRHLDKPLLNSFIRQLHVQKEALKWLS